MPFLLLGRFAVKKVLLICICLLISIISIIPVLANNDSDNIKIASGYRHVAFLNKDGRVMASGYNDQNQCNVYEWKNVIDISAGKYFTAALFEDGTVKTVGKDANGNIIDTESLKNIVKIDAGDNFLAALDCDGKVYVAGDVSGIDTTQWSEIKDIVAGSNHIAALKTDGSMVGAGSGVEGISEYTNIERIYAGAGLTVMIDYDGMLHYVGIGTYGESKNSEDGLIWIPYQWNGNDIKKIEITRGSNGNGIIVALLNDNTVISDGENDEMWTLDCSDVENAIDISLTTTEEYPVLTTLKDDMSIKVFGDLTSDLNDAGYWRRDIEKINVNKNPINKEHNEKIFVGYKNIALKLPDNSLKVIGEGRGAEEKKVDYFRYMIKSDNYIYEDLDGNIKSTVSVTDKPGKSFTWNKPNDIAKWQGIEEIATYEWDGNTELITGLRWDGQVYSTDMYDSVSKEVSNASDIVGGRYFTAVLHDDKTVSAYASKSTYDFSAVKDWTEIEKLFAGYGQLIGLKADGTCVAAGVKGDSNGYVAECDVEGWSDIVSAVCGYNFSIGLKSDGTCVVAAKEDRAAIKEEVEKWTDIKEIYASHSHIIGYKNDGTFEIYVTSYTRLEFLKLKKMYYKDNTYIYDMCEGNVAKVEYFSDQKINAYFTFYNAEGKLIKFEEKILEPVLQTTVVESKCEEAVTSSVSFGDASSEILPFYIEHKPVENGVKVNYYSDTSKRLIIAFYDNENTMKNVFVKTLPQTNELTELTFSCENATNYKIMIWEEMVPYYKAEGAIN